MPYIIAFVTFVLGLSAYRIFSDPALMDAIGRATTNVVRPLIIPVVELMSAPAFVFISSTVIFLSAMAVCVVYVLRFVRPAQAELGALEAALRAAAKAHDPRTRPPESLLKAAAATLQNSPALGAAWTAFQHDLNAEGRVPARMFSAYAAEHPSRRGQSWDMLIRALPGYYVSIGLILTFLGLVVALYVAARGMRAARRRMHASRSSIC